MENKPIFNISLVSRTPGADPEVFARYQKWVTEVYIPMFIKIPEVTGVDRYHIIRETLQYPSWGSANHYTNRQGFENQMKNLVVMSLQEDLAAWVKRGIRDSIWSAAYEQIKSYRSGSAFPVNKLDTRIDNAPIMSLEAFSLSPEQEDKYFEWFNEYGCNIFLPFFIKFPGLKGYDWYQYLGSGFGRRSGTRVENYPKYLSALYFDNIQAFNDFVNSQELASFLKAMRSVFPRGLEYRWYVQYQLTQSWRK
jgi:hypothetical protein